MWTRKGDDMSREPPSSGEDKRRAAYARCLMAEVEEYREQILNEESDVMILRLMDSDREIGMAFLRSLRFIRDLPERSHA